MGAYLYGRSNGPCRQPRPQTTFRGGGSSARRRRGFKMAKSPRRPWLMAGTAVVLFVAMVSLASADSTQTPGVHNGVITVCIEPATKGNKATSGDLNLLVCASGARRLSWNVRGPRGPAGSA